MSATLRPAHRADTERIRAIYNHAVAHSTATFDTVPKTAAEMQAWFDAHGARHPITVALDDNGSVVGYASLNAWSDRCSYETTTELSVYVDDRAQGRGLGRALMTDVIERGRAAGVHTVLSRIADGSEASAHLHRALGFEELGTMREVGRKFDRWLDVTLWQKML